MQVLRLRNKLLLSVTAIAVVMVLLFMLATSWTVGHQFKEQSELSLIKASRIILTNLDVRKQNILTASQQLANQKNLGSTIWYLAKYGQSKVDREMLLVTYLNLARDTYN